MRTIGFGWIGAWVRPSRRWCDRRDEGLRWCDWMGFLGAIEWVWRMGFLGLGFSGLSGVGFWVRRSRSRFLGLRFLFSLLWSENSNGNHFTPKQGYFPVKAEIIYRWPYFPCATKHPLLRKNISGNDLKSKQTQPKFGKFPLNVLNTM